MDKQKERFTKYLNIVQQTSNYNNIIIMGDFNVNMDTENRELDQNANEFKNMLLDVFPLMGLCQTVKHNTRKIQGQRSALLDHSWISNLNKHIKTSTFDTESDHDLIVTNIKIKGAVGSSEIVKKRDYSNFNEQEYLLDLLGLEWTKI